MEKTQFEVTNQNLNKSQKLPQYIAAFAVGLGMLAVGAALGWTANISEDMIKFTYKEISIDDDVLGWIGSIAILGQTFSCIPIGYLCDVIGRKKTLLYLTFPFMVGWLFIIYADRLWMIYLGRFLTGFVGGGYGVVAPIYISECSEKDIRGALSSFIDLMLTMGCFVANGLAMILEMKSYSISLSILPLVFAVVFAFQPESFIHYTKQDKVDKAKYSLIRLRGKSYDIDEELENVKLNVTENMQCKTSFLKSINKKAVKKAAFICYMLMIFQQTSGVEAIVLYTSTIFQSTGVDIDAHTSTLIFAAFEAFGTLLSILIVDRLGRRFLLIISSLGTGLALGALALFLTFENSKIIDDDTLSSLKYVPVVSLCVYIITYSLGLGPIPWFLSAELFPLEVNGIGCAGNVLVNSFSAFLVSKFYFNMQSAMGTNVTYYIYSGMTLLCVGFVYFFVPETKNKTFAEIQNKLNE